MSTEVSAPFGAYVSASMVNMNGTVLLPER
jgi:hypothetical protein